MQGEGLAQDRTSKFTTAWAKLEHVVLHMTHQTQKATCVALRPQAGPARVQTERRCVRSKPWCVTWLARQPKRYQQNLRGGWTGWVSKQLNPGKLPQPPACHQPAQPLPQSAKQLPWGRYVPPKQQGRYSPGALSGSRLANRIEGGTKTKPHGCRCDSRPHPTTPLPGTHTDDSRAAAVAASMAAGGEPRQ